MRNFDNLFKITKEYKQLEIIKIGRGNIILISCDNLKLKEFLCFLKYLNLIDGIVIIVNNLTELYYSDLDDYFDNIVCFYIYE